MSISRTRTLTCLIATGMAAPIVGCGGAQSGPSTSFDPSWQNDAGQSIARVEQRLRGAPLVPNARIAVGLDDGGLVAVSLDGKSHWTHPAHPSSAPFIAGKLVIYAEGSNIVALAASSGLEVWSIGNDGHALRSAASDGTNSALILADAHHSVFLGVSASGSRLGSAASQVDLGSVAARAGVAFVPWSNQYVSALDIQSGQELGRLLTRTQVSQALNYGGWIYFGEQALIRLDEKVAFASTNQANHVELPKVPLPGNPSWQGSGFATPSNAANARTKIRIYAAPATTPSGELTVGAGTFAASYFRALFGLDAKSGALRWVRALPADIVGGAAASAGFVICDAAGKMWVIDSAGVDAGSANFGSKLRLCSADTGDAPVAAGPGPRPLATQIAAALDALDPDMAEAERYLITELGKQEDPSVTNTLIELSSSPRIPPELQIVARRLLALRKNGTEFMLSALTRHYDFVSGVLLPPPVGPLADALAASGETRAAPLLAKHLNDPANSAEDVAHAARALVKLATAAEYEDLRTFFALYRATADDEALVAAVLSCAEAVLRVGGEAGRAVVERAAQDPLTQADVRRALPDVLQKLPPTGTAKTASAVSRSQTRIAPEASPGPLIEH